MGSCEAVVRAGRLAALRLLSAHAALAGEPGRPAGTSGPLPSQDVPPSVPPARHR